MIFLKTPTCYMAKKGKEKNTVNKAKHKKLMNRKKKKIKTKKNLNKQLLKAIIKKLTK